MNPSLSALGLSEIESVGVLVLLFTVGYVYYQYPRLLPGGQGVPLTGSVNESTPSQETCGPDCIVCPHCGDQNASVYTYCSNCARRVWTR